jgi:gamma-glutamyltranspeptidase/glutathione hydrolase
MGTTDRRTEESVPDDKGTSHIASADTAGVMCSITTTIGQLFASRIMVPGTGIMLNDSMDDFSVPGKHNHFGYAPSAVNTVAGGKRPLSSQSPYAIANSAGKPAFVGGSAGGATIISANVQVIRNLIAHGMGAREALSAPRLHTMATPGKVELEGSTDRGGPVVGWSEDAAAALRTRGHNVEWIKSECYKRW